MCDLIKINQFGSFIIITIHHAIDFVRPNWRVLLVFMEYSGLCSHQRIVYRSLFDTFVCCSLCIVLTKFIHRYLSQTSHDVYTYVKCDCGDDVWCAMCAHIKPINYSLRSNQFQPQPHEKIIIINLTTNKFVSLLPSPAIMFTGKIKTTINNNGLCGCVVACSATTSMPVSRF